jgi:hypothetical protein
MWFCGLFCESGSQDPRRSLVSVRSELGDDVPGEAREGVGSWGFIALMSLVELASR